MKINIFYLSIFLLFFQCQSGPVFKATDANNGSSYDIKKGEFFTVSLKAQLSTGFSWKADLSDGNIIIQEGKSKTITPGENNKIKTGGIELQQFTFKGLKKGSTTVMLNYSEPWNKKGPIKTYKINIIVK